MTHAPGAPEQLLGRNWFDTCVPGLLREQVRSVFQQLMAGDVQPVEYFENAVLTRSNQERAMAWHNTVLSDDAGGIIGTLSSGEDITERRQMERELVQREGETTLYAAPVNEVVHHAVQTTRPRWKDASAAPRTLPVAVRAAVRAERTGRSRAAPDP